MGIYLSLKPRLILMRSSVLHGLASARLHKTCSVWSLGTRLYLPLLLYCCCVHCVVYMVPFCIGIILYVYDIPLQCRELFLSNSGVEQLVSLTQPVNKVIVAMVTDIILQLSVESGEGV